MSTHITPLTDAQKRLINELRLEQWLEAEREKFLQYVDDCHQLGAKGSTWSLWQSYQRRFEQSQVSLLQRYLEKKNDLI